jgi:hypothetical protein
MLDKVCQILGQVHMEWNVNPDIIKYIMYSNKQSDIPEKYSITSSSFMSFFGSI